MTQKDRILTLAQTYIEQQSTGQSTTLTLSNIRSALTAMRVAAYRATGTERHAQAVQDYLDMRALRRHLKRGNYQMVLRFQ
ncbi:hypothetical protein [Deinococcus kurensis]|uniref:hypothetical protein n=1 Tax=Deinococcus kurensis TaxID=2662757 RepID=UPI0012D2CF79|nr:hypothetical protein [Deinococcus kurensis]